MLFWLTDQKVVNIHTLQKLPNTISWKSIDIPRIKQKNVFHLAVHYFYTSKKVDKMLSSGFIGDLSLSQSRKKLEEWLILSHPSEGLC